MTNADIEAHGYEITFNGVCNAIYKTPRPRHG